MRRIAFIITACCAALSLMNGCGGNEPRLVSNQTTVANGNAQQGNSSQAASEQGSLNASSRRSMGEFIETSAYDARIKRFEEQLKKKPNDEGARKLLAHAYLERGNALTQARQYGAALGDFRRTLAYDPNNEEARYWSDTITGIFNQMQRPVPTAGAEPTPLQKQ
jgi:tetratricopeptide (TPR) repeat protein